MLDSVWTDQELFFYFGWVGACIVFVKENPELFVEREDTYRGTFIRGISTEDLARAKTVAQHYKTRRMRGDYSLGRAPSVGSARSNWRENYLTYRENEDIAEEAARDEEEVFR